MSSLQVNAKNPHTFRPETISLPHLHYEYMIKGMNLPTNALELTAGVGPLFWWDFFEKNGKKRLGDTRKPPNIYKDGQLKSLQTLSSEKQTSKNKAALAAGS